MEKKMISKEKLLKLLIGDLRLLKQPEGWLTAGRPHRDDAPLQLSRWIEDREPTFDWFYGRDAKIAALMLLSIGNGPGIAKATLTVDAKLQAKHHNWKSEAQPGKTAHEARHTELLKSEIPWWEFPYYGSIDATPLFIILASEYAFRTEDWDFIKEIWGNLVAAARWMKEWGDVDGDYFIECRKLNPYGITNQVWKDHTPFCGVPKYPVAIVEVQGYAYLAWRRMQRMAAHFGMNEWREYHRDAEALRQNFDAMFWLPEKNFFALALDADKKPIEAVTSNQGQLLFTGIVSDPAKRKALANRLHEPDMWTPYGIRTLSDKEPCFNPYLYHLGSIWFHDNWLIWWGLNRYPEFKKEARELKQILTRTAQVLGEAPELHACENGKLKTTDSVSGWGTKPANHVQAWSAAAILNLLTSEWKMEKKKEIII